MVIGTQKNISRALMLLVLLGSVAFAARKLENLDRGLVAVHTGGSNVFVSWRLLGTEDPALGFNVYRNGTKLNASVITGANNYSDAGGSTTASYVVKTVVNGVETSTSAAVTPFSTGLTKRLPLNVPAAGTTPAGGAYTYSPNDGSAGDLNGDGAWDLVLKWDPSNSQDNANAGYTGNVYLDGMSLEGARFWRIDLGKNIRAGAHYTQFVVADFDSDGKAEIICKTAPGTKDGTGAFLSKGPAASDDDSKDYRNSSGYILSGPEYLTVFRGTDGKELATVAYVPRRHTTNPDNPTGAQIDAEWGDNYGNRVDRFLAAAAWVDGVKPSAIMQRGYYSRMAVTAWDWNGTTLSMRWFYDAKTSGKECFSQGNHNIAVGDVDADGKDEILQGACAINDNGTFMYRTGLGHGDAIHLGDLDPSRPGLEMWQVHEDKGSAYGYEMHDARTGEILWGAKTGTDNGRGLAADIDATSPGYEMWSASGAVTFSNKGVQVNASKPAINFRIYWDGDLQDELLDAIGNTPSPMKIDSWKNGRLVSTDDRWGAYVGHTNNTTKANPVLVADLLGDWREEMILRQSDNSALILYTTTTSTTHRLYTLMHDPLYRTSISWQNTAYNQPPHLGFFLGNGVANAPRPAIELVGGIPVPPSSSTTIPLSSAVAPSSSATAIVVTCGSANCTAAIQGENFCNAQGVAEATNTGFVGAGYLNFDNAIGSAGGFIFQASAAQNTTMYIHYANGGTASRNLSVQVGTQMLVPSVEFAATGAWTTWATKEVPISLPMGRDSLILAALAADGGPNVDWIGFAGTGISAGSCQQSPVNLSPAPLKVPALQGYFRGDELHLGWTPQGEFTVRLRSLTGASTRILRVEGYNSIPVAHLPAGLYSVELMQGHRTLGTFLTLHP